MRQDFSFDSDKIPSIYEVEIIQNNRYYKYGFELLFGKVLKEWLYKREERLTKVFERNGNKLEIMSVSNQAISLIKVPDTGANDRSIIGVSGLLLILIGIGVIVYAKNKRK